MRKHHINPEKSNYKAIWLWRHQIMHSDLHSTTRHVLLTVCVHMFSGNGKCSPTQKDLSLQTGLGENTISKHIILATRLGWLDTKRAGFKGQYWRGNSYKPKSPIGLMS